MRRPIFRCLSPGVQLAFFISLAGFSNTFLDRFPLQALFFFSSCPPLQQMKRFRCKIEVIASRS
jgi:hypothetical protein